jgi:hypothetical protein
MQPDERETFFRIYDRDGQPIDVQLKEISNIVVREDKGIVRCGFNYLQTDIGQAKALADAWAAFLKEESGQKQGGE